MTVSNTQIRVSYVGDGTSTTFPVPYLFYAVTDLLVLLGGVAQSAGYTVTGAGTGSGDVIFAAPPAVGVSTQIILNVPLTQEANLVDGTAFPSATLNQVNDRAIQASLRLYDLIQRSIRAPDGPDTVPNLLLPAAAVRALTNLGFDAAGNVMLSQVLASSTLSQQTIGQFLYPITPQEQAAGVTPVNYAYVPGCPRRFGAVGNGTADDTVAYQTAINSCDRFIGWPGDIYGVTSVTFPLGGPHYINAQGSKIVALATSATNACVIWAFDRTTVVDLRIDLNFSQNYLCPLQWYNASANSQYNVIQSLEIEHAAGVQTASGTSVRTVIYGALIGQSSTGFAQSENQIFGFRTRGCQIGFTSNHNNGVIHFAKSQHVCVDEDWSGSTYDFSKALTIEWIAGSIITDGGEIQIASPGATNAAKLGGGCYINNIFAETDVPILITAGGPILSGRFLQDQLQPCFTIAAGATGKLTLRDMLFTRPPGVGAFDNNPIVDASATTGAFEVIFEDTQSDEYRWTLVGADVRLVKAGANTTVRYRNHLMRMTAAGGSDNNEYLLNTGPTEANLLRELGIDTMGYTTTGWVAHTDSGTATLTISTSAGPTGYLASQFQIANSTGAGSARSFDDTSLTTLKATAFKVHPGELYLAEAWMQRTAGPTSNLTMFYYDLTGTIVSSNNLADNGSVTTAWKFMQQPFAVPASAAYMGIAVGVSSSTVQFTNVRICPA